jgi:hypothetical protein
MPAGMLLLLSASALAFVPSALIRTNAILNRAGPSTMGWSDDDWQWGSAAGEAHKVACDLRESLATPEKRASFLTDLGMMDPRDFSDSKVVLALLIQRLSERCFADEHGLDVDKQDNWREIMEEMAACRFEGYRGDILLAEAIMDRIGLIEGKRLASL